MIVSRVEETGIHRAVDEQPGQPRATGAIETSEHTTHHQLSVWLECDRVNGVVGAGTGPERGVQGACAQEAGNSWTRYIIDSVEVTTDNQASIRLRSHGVDRTIRTTARIEAGIQGTIFIQSRNVSAI